MSVLKTKFGVGGLDVHITGDKALDRDLKMLDMRMRRNV